MITVDLKRAKSSYGTCKVSRCQTNTVQSWHKLKALYQLHYTKYMDLRAILARVLANSCCCVQSGLFGSCVWCLCVCVLGENVKLVQWRNLIGFSDNTCGGGANSLSIEKYKGTHTKRKWLMFMSEWNPPTEIELLPFLYFPLALILTVNFANIETIFTQF